MKRKYHISDRIFDLSNMLVMCLLLIAFIYPFIYIISYSLSDPYRSTGGLIVLPTGFNLESYKVLLSKKEVLNGLLISVARTVIGPFLMVIFTSMASYSISRDDMMYVKLFRKYFIFTMYLSGGTIPGYILMKTLGLTNNFLAYIAPGVISVFSMVLIRAYIESLPKGLEDAAKIDGANELVLFFKVLFPLCKPVLAAVTLFSCVGHWNSYIDTHLYCSGTRSLHTLQYVLYYFLNAAENLSLEDAQREIPIVSPKTMRMAITVITVIPIACIYPFLQKYFASGLLIGSIKA